MKTLSGPEKQLSAPLPTGALLTGQFAAGCIAAVLWTLGTLAGGFGTETLLEGLVEVGLVTGVVLACTCAIAPWTVRPAGTWAVILIATSLVRLVVITGLTLLLYSAARMAPKALLVSAFVAIATVLIAETLVTTRFLSRLTRRSKPTSS